jgi:hypothetical protein
MRNALNCGKPNTRTLEIFRSVKPLKNAKQLADVFHIKANPVVSNEQHHLIDTRVDGSYFDLSW